MYVPLSDDEYRFVQKVHSARANGHWEHGRNSNPVASLPHAAVVCNHLNLFYVTEPGTEPLCYILVATIMCYFIFVLIYFQEYL